MNADEQIQQDRELLRAASKDSDDWDNATWAAWWRTAERHDPHFGHKVTNAAAAVADVGALPVPVGDQPQPLDVNRLAEIRERSSKRAAALSAWLNKFSPLSEGQREVENAETVLEEDVPALLAEVERLKAALASAREDVAFLHRATLPELRRDVEHHKAGKQRWRDRAEKGEARLSAVLDLCDREERNAMRWENPIPAPEWVALVQRAALGDDKRAEAAS